jgi:hypothetical protein
LVEEEEVEEYSLHHPLEEEVVVVEECHWEVEVEPSF